MAKVVGDVAVTVGADTSEFERGMRRATQDTEKLDRSFKGLAKRAVGMGAMVAASGVAIGAGAFAMAKGAADAGAEIERMARKANTTPEKFQKMAAAAREYGIEQGKLADQLRDVQDRVGDFLQTGGGPMADFFENIAPKVGVTADDFARLSGPEALQLYVSTLEKAKTPHADMVFYLEALSSDLSDLLPLLTNNGTEMQRLGDKAAEAGQVMSNEAVEGSAELAAEMERLGTAIRTKATGEILENKEAIASMTEMVNTVLIPALGALINVLGTVAEGYNKWGDAYVALRNKLGMGFDTPVELPPMSEETPTDLMPNGNLRTGIADDIISTTPDRAPTLNEVYDRILNDGTASGPVMNFDQMNDMLQGGSGQSEISGGEDGDALVGDMSLLSSADAVAEEYDARIAALSDYLQKRLETIGGFAGEEQELAADAATAIEDIEAGSRNARLSAAQGFFGEMAGMMRSGNEKMFKIGKAAALAEAVVSGHSAAVAAWENGMKTGGPPAAAAFAAASIARTASMISSIQSASANGGGGGVAAGAAPAAAPQPLQVMVSGPSPDTFVRWGDVPAMFDTIQDEAGDRGIRMVFA